MVLGIYQQSVLLIDGDAFDTAGHPILQNASQENYETPEAIALGEVLVRDGPSKLRDGYEAAVQSHGLVVRILQNIFRIRGIVQRGEDNVSQHSQARACAADRHAVFDPLIYRFLHRRALPILHVVRLVAARDEDGLGLHDLIADSGVFSFTPVWDD